MKTIREIADEIGVTTQAVHKRINREPLCGQIRKHRTPSDNHVYMDVDGEKLIKQAFLRTRATTNRVHGCRSVHGDVHSDFMSFLQEQIRIKDSQIAELNAIIKTQASSPKARRNKENPRIEPPKSKSAAVNRLFEGAK